MNFHIRIFSFWINNNNNYNLFWIVKFIFNIYWLFLSLFVT